MRSSCTNRCFLFQLFFQNNFSFLQRDCIIRKIVFHPIFEVWGGILNLACSMTRLDIDRTWEKKLYNLTRKDSELETRGKIFRNRTYNCCTHRIYRGIGGTSDKLISYITIFSSTRRRYENFLFSTSIRLVYMDDKRDDSTLFENNRRWGRYCCVRSIIKKNWKVWEEDNYSRVTRVEGNDSKCECHVVHSVGKTGMQRRGHRPLTRSYV